MDAPSSALFSILLGFLMGPLHAGNSVMLDPAILARDIDLRISQLLDERAADLAAIQDSLAPAVVASPRHVQVSADFNRLDAARSAELGRLSLQRELARSSGPRRKAPAEERVPSGASEALRTAALDRLAFVAALDSVREQARSMPESSRQAVFAQLTRAYADRLSSSGRTISTEGLSQALLPAGGETAASSSPAEKATARLREIQSARAEADAAITKLYFPSNP